MKKYIFIFLEDRIKCSLCSQTFCDKTYLKKHYLQKHKNVVDEEWINCPKCEKKFPSTLHLKIHNDLMHKPRPRMNKERNYYFCNFCQMNVVKTNRCKTYVNHCNDLHLSEVSAIWTLCDFCGLYILPKLILVHQQLKHTGRQCEFCTKLCSDHWYNHHVNTNHIYRKK